MFKATLLLAGLLLAACQTLPAQPSLAARQIAVLKQQGFEQEGDNWMLGIPDRLLFGVDDSQLRPQQAERLRSLSSTLSGVGIRGARVEGNTDSTGSARYNQELSLRRADTVKQAMVDGGMQSDTVRTLGLGETNPIESNKTSAGRHENRRVVIIVTEADLGEATDPQSPGPGTRKGR